MGLILPLTVKAILKPIMLKIMSLSISSYKNEMKNVKSARLDDLKNFVKIRDIKERPPRMKLE
jgi:hypothetical protein